MSELDQNINDLDSYTSQLSLLTVKYKKTYRKLGKIENNGFNIVLNAPMTESKRIQFVLLDTKNPDSPIKNTWGRQRYNNSSKKIFKTK